MTTRGPVQLGSSTLLAVQLVAFPLPQVNVLDPPSAIAAKSALSVGPGAAPTVTVVWTNSEAPPLPDIAIWPKEREARAMARSVSAEMHSGFENLRTEMPMDMAGSKPVEEVSKGVAHDIARIIEIWRMCREAYTSSNSEAVGQTNKP